MPISHPHRARYAPLRRATTPATTSSHFRSAYLCTRSYLDRTWRAFFALPPEQRYFIYLAAGVKLIILGVVIYIGPEAMFDATAKLAIWFGSQPFGAALLIALVVTLSFPPLVGYGTSITLCGLGWGVHTQATSQHTELNGNLFQAWILASTACLLGATVSFSVLRFLIIHHSKRVTWISNTLNDAKYVALSTAVRRRGLSMVILIRFCPFPFAYSNLFFASLVDAVSFPHFLAATALITPKLFLHVWLGTRMFQLMDRDERAQLDGWAKALNVIYIAVGSAVGVATGWIVWSETTKVLRTIESEQQSGTDSALPSSSNTIQRSSSVELPFRDASHQNKNHSDRSNPFVLDVEDQDEETEQEDLDQGRDMTQKSLLPR